MTLRLTAELVPLGNEDRKSTIAVIDISNIGRLDEWSNFCRYKAVVKEADAGSSLRPGKVVEGLPHDRGDGWDILARIALAGLRNGLERPTRGKSKA